VDKDANQKHCLVVVISLDQLSFTRGCLDSIEKNTKYPYKVLVIDNGSKQETLSYLNKIKKSEKIDIIFNKSNLGWVKAVNQGLFYSGSSYVCVMNNDTIVYPGWLQQMVKGFEADKTVGIVNPLWEVPKKFRGSRDQYFKQVITKQKDEYIDTDWARGFCYLVKREVIDAAGGLDYDFSPAYYDDWDFSLRVIKKGYKCIRAKGAFVYHYKNVSYPELLGKEGFNKVFKEKARIFHQKWGFPLKVFFIAGAKAPGEITVIQGLVQKLLRAQDKIYIASRVPIGIKHTNCFLKIKKNFISFWVTVFFALLNNLRHSKIKRFNLIVSDKKGLIFNKFSFVKNNYDFIVLKSGQKLELDTIYKTIESKKKYINQ
jgi:GT2 family glycosyltransferase